MIPRWLRLAGVLIVLIVGIVVGGAAPAAAHAGGLTPQNYRSVVTGIEPAVPGLSAVMVNNGTQLELHNGGRVELVVLTDTAAPQVVSPGETLRYRDARTVWPQAVRTWRVPIRTVDGEAAIVGLLEWKPGPTTVWWLLLTVMFGAIGYLVGWSPWWRPGLAGGVVAVTGANVAHAVGSASAVTGQSLVPLFLGASGVGLVCWPLALVAVITAVRRRPSTAFVAAVVGAMLVVAGIPDFDSFRYSQLPFAGSPDVDRLLVAITLGGGTGLAVGGFTAMRRVVATQPVATQPEGG